MKRFGVLAAMLVGVLLLATAAGTGAAQAQAFVQIEAQPDIRSARQRARLYAADIDDVRAFRTPTGWYAIALGPYDEGTANALLASLRRSGRIPPDSFIADGGDYLSQVWPVYAAAGLSGREVASVASPAASGGITVTGEAGAEAANPDAAEEGEATQITMAPAVEDVPEETPAQARRLERRMSREEKIAIQEALIWTGDYQGKLDGAFGSGTRRAIRQYQARMGYEPTGYLTTRQINELTGNYAQTIARLGFREVREEAAGIAVKMPTALVRFDHYDPPFVHYAPVGDSGVRVLLISQEGNRDRLAGLYDLMQTLEIVPLEGDRKRRKDFFVLTGRDEKIASYTYVRHENGFLKGFTLIWPPTTEEPMEKVAAAMVDSLRSLGDYALDEALGQPPEDQRVDLIAGLEVRKPERTASGFFVDAAGTVLTDASAVQNCRRVTVADEHPVRVAWIDEPLGVAALTPEEPLAPMGVARIGLEPPRLRSDIVVAGYAFGGLLGAPTQSWGRLADLRGLGGEEALMRLELEVQPSDMGGPVLDEAGRVIGLLRNHEMDGQVLPSDVQFAVKAEALLEAATRHGLRLSLADAPLVDHPTDLAQLALEITAQVDCWN